MKKSILFLLVMGFCICNAFAQYGGDQSQDSYGDSMLGGSSTHEAGDHGNYRMAPNYVVKLSGSYDLQAAKGFTEGEHDVKVLKEVLGNDGVSCLEVSEGYVLIAFPDAEFKGKAREFVGPAKVSLKDDKFDNQISSIKVKKITKEERERRLN